MSSGNRIFGFIKAERLYLLMLIFIMAANLFVMAHPPEKKDKVSSRKKIAKLMSRQEIMAQERRIRELLEKNRFLGSVITTSAFLSALILLLGLILCVRGLALKLSGRNVMVAYGAPPDVGWGLIDICRIATVFFFFGYVLAFAGSIVSHVLAIKSHDDRLATVLHATIMDIIGISIVLYFVSKKFNGGLASLGISFRNTLRDIRIGVIGYVTTLPILALILVIVITILQITRYDQPTSTALEILYEDSRPKLLLVLTVLVTFLGPIAEEMFFRGFAYPAVRKRLGIKNAMILVSVVFAMLHMNVVAFFPILGLGILLAYLYEKTGSLIPSIAVHVIHNSAVIFLAYLYKIIALPK
jgi:membrane protease YdiL (CAAX protease family)